MPYNGKSNVWFLFGTLIRYKFVAGLQ